MAALGAAEEPDPGLIGRPELAKPPEQAKRRRNDHYYPKMVAITGINDRFVPAGAGAPQYGHLFCNPG